MRQVRADDLRQFCRAALLRCLLPEEHPAIVADHLMESRLRGVTSHGVRRLPIYTRRIRRGHVEVGVEPALVQEKPLAAVMDGRNGLEIVNAYRAMSLALANARKYGIGIVAVRRSNHLGRAAHFAEMGLQQDCIDVCLTNSSGGSCPGADYSRLSATIRVPWRSRPERNRRWWSHGQYGGGQREDSGVSGGRETNSA